LLGELGHSVLIQLAFYAGVLDCTILNREGRWLLTSVSIGGSTKRMGELELPPRAPRSTSPQS
jgi:hypothetical protein